MSIGIIISMANNGKDRFEPESLAIAKYTSGTRYGELTLLRLYLEGQVTADDLIAALNTGNYGETRILQLLLQQLDINNELKFQNEILKITTSDYRLSINSGMDDAEKLSAIRLFLMKLAPDEKITQEQVEVLWRKLSNYFRDPNVKGKDLLGDEILVADKKFMLTIALQRLSNDDLAIVIDTTEVPNNVASKSTSVLEFSKSLLYREALEIGVDNISILSLNLAIMKRLVEDQGLEFSIAFAEFIKNMRFALDGLEEATIAHREMLKVGANGNDSFSVITGNDSPTLSSGSP